MGGERCQGNEPDQKDGRTLLGEDAFSGEGVSLQEKGVFAAIRTWAYEARDEIERNENRCQKD